MLFFTLIKGYFSSLHAEDIDRRRFDMLDGTFYFASHLKEVSFFNINSLIHGLFSDPFFSSSTKRFAKSRVFRYRLPNDILSKGQKDGRTG